MEITCNTVDLKSNEDLKNEILHDRTCELINNPQILGEMIHRLFPEVEQACLNTASVAEAILSDNDKVVDRLVIDKVIESIWNLAECEFEAANAKYRH